MRKAGFALVLAAIFTAGFFSGRLFFPKTEENLGLPQRSGSTTTTVDQSADSIAAKNGSTSLTTSATIESGAVRVARVIDGDTIVIDGGERVRYIGMDTPEIGAHIRNTFGRDSGESLGSTRSKDEGVSHDTPSPKQQSDAQDSSNPEGLRRISGPAALRFGRSASSTAPSSSLADTGYSHATRREGISDVGSDPRKPVQCFGRESAARNRELVEGKLVRLEKDISDRDKYHRLLRYIYLSDGTFVNLELVKEGYATASTYPPDVAHAKEFVVAEKEAREAKRGLWSTCKGG